MPKSAKYTLRFWIEWGATACLWAADEATRDAFGGGVSYVNLRILPLSAGIIYRLEKLCMWYQEPLNWDYPPDPGPWRQAECDRFNAEVQALLQAVSAELGEAFEVKNAQPAAIEDPGLDEYLKGSKAP